MNFEEALKLLREGKKVRLKGQQGYSFVKYRPDIGIDELMFHTPDLPYPISSVFRWKDIMADDWEEVE